MTNFLPALSASMQTIEPSLEAAASRMTAESFCEVAERTRSYVLQEQYGKLTQFLERRLISSTPEAVNQLCWGRHLFFGESPPHNLQQALQRVPQICGDETSDGLLAMRGEWKDWRKEWQIAQGLVNLCGPSFRGDFSRLKARLNEMTPSPDQPPDQHERVYLDWSTELLQALHLKGDLGSLLTVSHRFRLAYRRDFFIRILAGLVMGPLTSLTIPEMRAIFFRGFVCEEESIRMSFIRLTPALCADPSVEEGIKIGGLTALRNAWQNDPSPAIRRAATYALTQMPK